LLVLPQAGGMTWSKIGGFSMIVKLIKWITIAALFLALFWQPFAESRILLQYVVWVGAIVVFAQALRSGKYLWIGLFLAVAVLFNPIRPVAFSPGVSLVANAITLVLFMVSLGRGLRTKPRLSIASITDRTPGSESLWSCTSKVKGGSMTDTINAGTIMMQAGTLIPESLRAEAEPYWHGWEMIQEADGDILDRNIRRAGWSFFFMAMNIRAMVWGSVGKKNVRRAVQRVLEKVKLSKFNCLEITEISARRFLGFPYVHLSAHSRHLQRASLLQSLAERSRSEEAAAWCVG
jgi:hypothetical protein